VCVAVLEDADLRGPNESHEIGRDANDVEVDAETPDEDEGVWGKGAEKPSRDSDADSQASHPTVSGTGGAHAVTRPLKCHRSPSSQRTGSSNVPSNSDSRRVFPDADSPWAIGNSTFPMLARISSKEMHRVLVAFVFVKAGRPARVLAFPGCWRIETGFVGDVEGSGNA
jgi:hypothetical protein